MNKLCIALAIGVSCAASAGSAQAQFGPVIWTQPAPVVWQQPAPVVWQSAPTVFTSPVIVPQKTVITTPVQRFYRAPIIAYKPTRYVVRRPRLFGGYTTTTRYGVQRVAF
jgi:hypothetical protein